MSKGLGKLQRCILNELSRIASGEVKISPNTHNIYMNVEEAYWGEVIHMEQFKWHEVWWASYDEEDKPELNRRRASIGQALCSLKRRELIGYLKTEDVFWITEKGKEAIRIKPVNI